MCCLYVLLVGLVLFFGLGVIRSSRAAQHRLLGFAGVAAVIILCAGASTYLLPVGFGPGGANQDQVAFVVKKFNAQFPQPVGQLGTWQRLDYADGLLSARFDIDRSKVEDIDWDRMRANFTNIACAMWTGLTGSRVRRFEGHFYSGTTLFRTISVTRPACSEPSSA